MYEPVQHSTNKCTNPMYKYKYLSIYSIFCFITIHKYIQKCDIKFLKFKYIDIYIFFQNKKLRNLRI